MAQLAIFNVLLLFLCTVIILNVFANDIHERSRRGWGFSTCARMHDGPVGAKIARGLCINSCKFQNAGTGYCVFRQNRPVCVCSRFGQGGGEWPSLPNLPRKPGK